MEWSFDDNPSAVFPIICDVLPSCTYDLILGDHFLAATETLSRFQYRLTQCIPSATHRYPRFSLLGGGCQRLRGTLADVHSVHAIADTGAECNVIDLDFARWLGLKIRNSQDYGCFLQLADGTYQETAGQIKTHWIFKSGQRIPMTFEVLENCFSDVVIGEEVLDLHNVFQDHSKSFTTRSSNDDSYTLAPFDFIRPWQRPFKKLDDSLRGQNSRGTWIIRHVEDRLIETYSVKMRSPMPMLQSRVDETSGIITTIGVPQRVRGRESWSGCVGITSNRVNAQILPLLKRFLPTNHLRQIDNDPQ